MSKKTAVVFMAGILIVGGGMGVGFMTGNAAGREVEVSESFEVDMVLSTSEAIVAKTQRAVTAQTGAEPEASAEEPAFAGGLLLENLGDGRLMAAQGITVEAASQVLGDEEDSEYADLAIANVDKYVNVRSEPNTNSTVLGKIYDGAVAHIIEEAGEDNDWFHVTSGNVEGYIKAEYFIYGDAALEVIDNYVTRYAVVLADRLNVRQDADLGAKRIGYLERDERAKMIEDCGEWLKIQYAEDKTGYVSAEYVTISEEFIYAKSIEEERAQQEALRALQERQQTSEASAPENTQVEAPPNTSYADASELRQSIVDYALQFVGCPYVNGGNSLTEGTDCSGFTKLIYEAYGYSLGRTPSSQLSSAGRSISYSEAQPGDILCYGGKSCTHVAIYIGDGQIVHAATPRKGIVVASADCVGSIIGVKNVID